MAYDLRGGLDAACGRALEEALGQKRGVRRAECDTARRRVRVTYDLLHTDSGIIARHIRAAGFRLAGGLRGWLMRAWRKFDERQEREGLAM